MKSEQNHFITLWENEIENRKSKIESRKSNENFESVSQSNFIRFSNFDFRLLIFDFVLPEGKIHFQNKFVAKIFIFIIIIMKVHRNITVIPPNDGECPYLKPYYLLKIEDQIKPF